MNDFIAKPVEPAALFGTLIRWLPQRAHAKPATDETQPQPHGGDDENVRRLRIMLAALDNPELEHAIRIMGGDVQRFARMLRDFAERNRNEADMLKSLLAENQLHEASQIAHRLKGAAGTLGLARLRLAAANLETALRENRTDNGSLAALLAGLKQEMNLVEDTVAGMHEMESFDFSPAAGTPDTVRPLLSKLEKLLEVDDTAAYDLFNDNQALLEQAFGPAAATLAKQIDGFDYQSALDTVRKLLAAAPAEGQ